VQCLFVRQFLAPLCCVSGKGGVSWCSRLCVYVLLLPPFSLFLTWRCLQCGMVCHSALLGLIQVQPSAAGFLLNTASHPVVAVSACTSRPKTLPNWHTSSQHTSEQCTGPMRKSLQTQSRLGNCLSRAQE